jgi:cob(I)alamin adenosyltransferase
MKIYTKVGDNGNTSLYDGSKVAKDNIVIDCIGDLDELNSELGCIIASLDKNYEGDEKFLDLLVRTQSYLFDLGALIAHPSDPSKKNIRFDKDGILTSELEAYIDLMTSHIPKLVNFILPGGNISMCYTHKSRTVCRRVERKMVVLKTNEISIDDTCYKYINRLSDYLFTFARYIGHVSNVTEVIYRKNSYER